MSEEQRKPKSAIATRGAGGRAYRIPEERYIAARALYESTPGISIAAVADAVGVHYRSLEDRRAKDKAAGNEWKKIELMPPKDMNEKAQAIADSYTGKLADYGPEISPEQKKLAAQEVITETAEELRGQLLERHRREWGAIRTMVYEGIKKREYGDVAKLAKISAETLQIVQSNERKAWGIDKPSEGGHTIIIERG